MTSSDTHRPLRVLFVTTSFPRHADDFPGSFVFRIAKYLVRAGVAVTALAPHAAGCARDEEMEGVRVRRVPYFWPTSRQRLFYDGGGTLANLRNSWLARAQVPSYAVTGLAAVRHHLATHDVVHCHWLPTAMLALAARTLSRHRPPIVFTNWGSDTRLLPQPLVRAVLRRVEGCVSTAAETDRHLVAAGRTEFRQVMAPVDEDRFAPGAVADDLRDELRIAAERSVVAFVGRLDAFKDPVTFLEAVPRFGSDAVGVLIGDGDLRPQCERTHARLALGPRALILGARNDPERLLAIARVFVHISPVENTWANSIAEAMVMGVPVVMTDVGATRELFTSERDCLLVPPRDPEALAAAVRRILDDPALARRLVDGARDLLRRTGKDAATATERLVAYYREVLSRGA